jgi:hypothetical protein
MGLFSDLRKKKITAEMIQGATDAAKRLTPMVGDAYVTVTSTPTGTAIGLRDVRKNPRVGKEVSFALSTKVSGRSGVYGVTILSGNGEDAGSGRVSPEIAGGSPTGSAVGAVTAYAHHTFESDDSFGEHMLALGSTVYRGFYNDDTASDGLPIIVFTAFAEGETEADPIAVGDTDEGSETADATTWTRGDGPLELSIMTRVAYYDAGDKKLYGYIRTLKVDALGVWWHASGETRVEVDVPVTGCS